MPYPNPSDEQIAFYREHGWLVVEDAVPHSDLDAIEAHCEQILEDKQRYAMDWAWDEKESREGRSFRIVQGFPAFTLDDSGEKAYRKWAVSFGSALMNLKLHFWYDQFLAKPPGGVSVPTYWHQDEGYWGRRLIDKGITCWIPLQDVDPENGCMHFIDRGHRDGVLEHRLVEGVKSDLLTCDVDESRMVVCPIKRGSVTFHHSKTPHMTTANTSQRWRKALTNHLKDASVEYVDDHYPWRVMVNQLTGGERVVPQNRPLEEGRR
jgi:ectoine hydroxylase-related dioxygenase (phytanoyl-CoA dioxygenase family)